MAKKQTQTTTIEAPATPVQAADPRGSTHFPGIADRDLAFIEALTTDLSNLARALRKGDKDAIRALYPGLAKRIGDAPRAKLVARRALGN